MAHKKLTSVATEWRSPIGCHKFQVSFRERATNDRALLRQMNYKYKTFYGSSPSCILRMLRHLHKRHQS